LAIFLRNGQKAIYDETQDKQLKKLYGHIAGRAILKVMTLPVITNIGGAYMNSPLSKASIKKFIKKNNIDMTEYEEKSYKSYNDFFTRAIKEGARPIPEDPKVLMAPCDSKVSYYKIEDDTKITIKHTVYKLEDLLKSPRLADEYKGGTCLVFRLTVDDYHHYHYFDNGTSEKEVIIPGIFHTVNPIANDYYPIYKTNTRHYTMIHSENFDDVVYMEVGALMVGKIVNANKKEFKRGEEKGYFEFGGSTVVLLFKKDILNVDEDIIQHSKNHDEVKVKLGERVAIHL
jgi:phosphatidylserine decarboxylase